jgi:threonine aldolase
MPVTIPLSELSNMINASVKDLIYQDDSYTDNNNDQFKVKVWKTRPIRLVGGTNQNLLIEVPLKIWAEKGMEP